MSALRSGTMAIRIQPEGLDGFLGFPEGTAKAIVIFAHGSGSGRFSPRNTFVADALRRAGLATLLLDLLTAGEEPDRRNVFDIPLLAARLARARDWLRQRAETGSLEPCLFGASTGAAAAMLAAGDPGSDVVAVVSRGGRPDLVPEALCHVRAPTLLLVGSRDEAVIDMNRRALALLRCEKRLTIVEGAGHLFEEPGTLEAVVRHATAWFLDHLHSGREDSAQ